METREQTMLTIKRILREINNPHLSLYKGNGYFYFSYDNGDIYDTYSVFTCQLDTLTIEQWKEEAAFFINALESQ